MGGKGEITEMSQTAPCSFVKSSAHTTVHHFGAEDQGPETLSPAKARAAQPGRNPAPRLAPRPREGQRLGLHHTARRKVRKGWCFSLWADGETEAPGKAGSACGSDAVWLARPRGSGTQCRRTCCASSAASWKRRGQSGQVCGGPARARCVARCRDRWLERLKALPQAPHVKGLRSECDTRWLCSRRGLAKTRAHSGQL